MKTEYSVTAIQVGILLSACYLEKKSIYIKTGPYYRFTYISCYGLISVVVDQDGASLVATDPSVGDSGNARLVAVGHVDELIGVPVVGHVVAFAAGINQGRKFMTCLRQDGYFLAIKK